MIKEKEKDNSKIFQNTTCTRAGFVPFPTSNRSETFTLETLAHGEFIAPGVKRIQGPEDGEKNYERFWEGCVKLCKHFFKRAWRRGRVLQATRPRQAGRWGVCGGAEFFAKRSSENWARTGSRRAPRGVRKTGSRDFEGQILLRALLPKNKFLDFSKSNNERESERGEGEDKKNSKKKREREGEREKNKTGKKKKKKLQIQKGN
jgi:hypothetical protein